MLRIRRRMMWKRVRGLGLVIGLGAILVLAAGVASAKKPGKPPKPEEPVDTGIIYCRLDSDVYSMSPDGSGKTFLYSGQVLYTEPLYPEPSNLSHGGRWFLEVRPTNTGETYPPFDPANPNERERARHELFAVSESGTTEVQLTDDMSLEAIVTAMRYGQPRWAPGDTKVSWFARRWDLNTGEVIEMGIYAAAVDPEALGIVEPSVLPCSASLPIIEDRYGPRPAVYGYDWSPDGEKIVYAESSYGWGQGLHVADVDSGSTFTLTSEGMCPRWSPDGSKIAFHHEKGIDTIDAAGGNRVNIVSVRGHKKNTITEGEYAFAPQWSPSGSHLVYRYENRKTSWMWTVDICRVAADGTDQANLTKDTEASASPLGWRAD